MRACFTKKPGYILYGHQSNKIIDYGGYFEKEYFLINVTKMHIISDVEFDDICKDPLKNRPKYFNSKTGGGIYPICNCVLLIAKDSKRELYINNEGHSFACYVAVRFRK